MSADAAPTELLSEYCAAMEFWARTVPLGLREMTRGEQVAVGVQHPRPLSNRNGSERDRQVIVLGQFLCLQPAGDGGEPKGIFERLSPVSETCSCGMLGLAPGELCASLGKGSDAGPAGALTRLFSAPVGACFARPRLLSKENILSSQAGDMLLLGTTCSPFLSPYRVTSSASGGSSQICCQGVATHEVIIVADHLLGPHGDRVLAASAETLCDATGCLTNAYSVPPVYLPERLMGLVTDLRDHFANPAEVEDNAHLFSSTKGPGLRRGCVVSTQPEWEANLAIGLTKCLEIGSQKISSHIRSMLRGGVDRATGHTDFLRTRMSGSSAGFNVMPRRLADTRASAITLSDHFCECLRIVTDLCTISLFPAVFISHVSSCAMRSQKELVNAPTAPPHGSRVSGSLHDTELVSERILLPSLTPHKTRMGLKGIEEYFVALERDLFSIRLEELVNLTSASEDHVTPCAATRRIWCRESVSLLNLRTGIELFHGEVRQRARSFAVFRDLDNSLQLIQHRIDAVLATRRQYFALVNSCRIGAISAEDMLRQDWAASAPFRRGRKLSFGIATLLIATRSILFNVMDAFRNSPLFFLSTGSYMRFFLCNLAFSTLLHITVHIFDLFRMRLDQLSTDYRSTVLQLIQLRCRLCHFLGLSVGGTGSATCDRSTAVLGDGHCGLISSSFCDGSLAYTVAGGSCSPNDNSAVLLQDLDKLFVKCLLDIYFRTCPIEGILQVLASGRACPQIEVPSKAGADLFCTQSGHVCLNYDFLFPCCGTAQSSPPTQGDTKTVSATMMSLDCANSMVCGAKENIMLKAFIELELSTRRSSEAPCDNMEFKNLDSILTPEFMLSNFLVGMSVESGWLSKILRCRYELLEDEVTGHPKLDETQILHRRAVLGVVEGIAADSNNGDMVYCWQ